MSSPPRKPSAIADAEAELGPDRAFVLQQMPSSVRPAIEAMWRVDAAMGDVVARSTDPVLARIKLAWWRERLEQLDHAPPPAEPRLQVAATELLALGVRGAELASLEPGWATLLDAEFDSALVAARGARLFALTGRLLGSRDSQLEQAGALYALASAGRRGVPRLLEPAGQQRMALARHRFESRDRVLTMLARGAARDLDGPPFEAEGSRGRLLAMLAHRWTGRI